SFSTHPTPSCQDSSITGGTLQGDGRLRTTLEEKRVSARWGWAGEKGVIFSILLAGGQIGTQDILPGNDAHQLVFGVHHRHANQIACSEHMNQRRERSFQTNR